MNNYNFISFVSLSIGWIGLVLTHILWSFFKYEDASGGETGVVIFWSGLFSLLFYLLFILLPKKVITKQLETKSFIEFTIGSGLYSLLGFTVLIGWLFLNSDFFGVFIDAFVAGLIFGTTFWYFWNKSELNFESVITKLIGYLIPIVFLIFYLKIFPSLFPTIAYNYVPSTIKNDIEIKTLSKIKIGDSIEEIKDKLPGFIGYEECIGSRAGQYDKFQFRLQWNCCKVVDIEVGERGSFSSTLGGEILKKPCE